MSKFKFKGWILDNYFPRYFKEQDTYKGDDGRGILERFLDVCGEYFDNQVVLLTENLINQIDIEQVDTLFLNYWWEYFGELPLAWGLMTQGIKHYEIPNNNLLKWNNTLKGYPKADSRKALRYIISLYKIRGTELFYQVLGRIYGINIHLDQVPCEKCNPNPNPPIAKDPSTERCDDCVCYSLRIGIPQGIWDKLSAEEDWELTGKKYILDTFVSIVEKYLPVYAHICANTKEIYPWSIHIRPTTPLQTDAKMVETSKDTVLEMGNSTGVVVYVNELSLVPNNLILRVDQESTILASIDPPNADYSSTRWTYIEQELDSSGGYIDITDPADQSVQVMNYSEFSITLKAKKVTEYMDYPRIVRIEFSIIGGTTKTSSASVQVFESSIEAQ